MDAVSVPFWFYNRKFIGYILYCRKEKETANGYQKWVKSII